MSVMRESTESINLMRLNCELINLKNSNIYSKGISSDHHSLHYLKYRITELYKTAGFRGSLKRICQDVFFRFNNKRIIDYIEPFKERQADDYVIDDFHYVGRGVVYTAIYGGYDKLQEPLFVSDNLDYFAFTDQEIPQGSVWRKIDISVFKQLEGLDDYHKAKYFKMFPYEFFPNYDFSIWVDGNVKMVADIYPLAIMSADAPIAAFENPHHVCIFTEKNYMVFNNRVSVSSINKQVNDYKIDGFPHHFGMRELSIIYRNHSDRWCYELMKEWWEQVNKYTMRDQISLPYLLWKHGKDINYIKSLGGNWRLNPRFICLDHRELITYK